MLNTSILFFAKKIEEGKPVAYSNGKQRVVITLRHQRDVYVLVHDSNTDSMYINKLQSMLCPDIYVSDNFKKIEDEEEWQTIYNLIKEYGVNL